MAGTFAGTMRNHPVRAVFLAALIVMGAGGAWSMRPIGPAAFVEQKNAIAFFDRAGMPLGTVAASDDAFAVHVPLAAVSPRFLAAIVAVEDARFRSHHGIDLVAVAAATIDAVRARRVVRGASTITMQLAQLRYGLPRTPWGKVLAALTALRIEAGTSKAAILEAYVNRLPFGSDIVGVEAAARTYFGTPASDLDWAQATELAALPNDPVRLDPYRRAAALETRRQSVIAYLRARGVLSAAEAERARTERLEPAARALGVRDAPHLLFRLAASAPPGTTRITTTIDRDLQRFVANATHEIAATLHDRNGSDAAAIVVDNATGDVVAYAGSPDYFDDATLGRNDGVTALRQPGSALKPFLYELAFERRAIRPATILFDVPTVYSLPGARMYAPSDYSGRFEGPVRPRIALADSLNVPAVRTLDALGVATFQQRLRALGFAHLDRPAADYGLGLALGSGEVTLEELARAYATIAREGKPVQLRYRADDPSAPANERVGSATDWALVTDILADAHARAGAFGVVSLLRLPVPSAVKTGTSSDFRDTWTIGFTRAYTVATWAGNFDGAPMRDVSGITGAAPLWNRIMLHLAERSEPAGFTPPHGYARTAICARTGALPDRSCGAVVLELLDAGDRRMLRRAPRTGSTVQIESPLDGALYRPGGTILVRATAPSPSAIRWTLDGRGIATGGAWSLPLRRGTYTLVASAGGASARATIRVAAAAPDQHRAGFTLR